jgi:hypothetical protein
MGYALNIISGNKYFFQFEEVMALMRDDFKTDIGIPRGFSALSAPPDNGGTPKANGPDPKPKL